MRQGVLHRPLGDLVEGDPVDLDTLQRALRPQHLLHVPGDGLALAIRIGGEEQALGPLHRLGDGGHLFLAPVLAGPVHGEVLIRAHAAVLGGQVPHMAEAGEDGEVRAQILVDGLRLGRRFDDDDVGHGRCRVLSLATMRAGRTQAG
jgi:hypothetical protein